MFLKRNAYNAPKEPKVKYQLHDWIAAISNNKEKGFFANPNRPRFYEISQDSNRKLLPMEMCTPPVIQFGDVVWISFTVEIIIGVKWYTNFVAREIVRVATVLPELVGDGTWGRQPVEEATDDIDGVLSMGE